MEQADTRQLAETMMRAHGLDGWTFKFHRATSRIGQAHLGRRVISMSSVAVEKMALPEVEQTILHEIAHALAPPKKINGRWDIHGAEWQAKAAEIGYLGSRTKFLDFDHQMYSKSAARWRRNNGKDPDITPPMRVGGEFVLKGGHYRIERIDRVNVLATKINSDDKMYRVRKQFAEITMVA